MCTHTTVHCVAFQKSCLQIPAKYTTQKQISRCQKQTEAENRAVGIIGADSG